MRLKFCYTGALIPTIVIWIIVISEVTYFTHQFRSLLTKSQFPVMSMEYTKLGASELLVSKVCLGSMTWGQQNSEAEGCAQMEYAFKECGINFVDTAEIYPQRGNTRYNR